MHSFHKSDAPDAIVDESCGGVLSGETEVNPQPTWVGPGKLIAKNGLKAETVTYSVQLCAVGMRMNSTVKTPARRKVTTIDALPALGGWRHSRRAGLIPQRISS